MAKESNKEIKWYQWMLFVGFLAWLAVQVVAPGPMILVQNFAPDNSIKNSAVTQYNYATEIEYELLPAFGEDFDFRNASYTDKVAAIKSRLSENEINGDEQEKLVKVFHLESCRNTTVKDCFEPSKLPITTVYHCRKTDGSYKAVEHKKVGNSYVQAHCSDYGWEQVGSEHSIGIAQILVSTWKGNACDGNARDYMWYQQIDCAAKIYKGAGITQWSSYSLLSQYSDYVK